MVNQGATCIAETKSLSSHRKEPPMPINIIFDIGGVLTDFDWDSFVSKYLDPETADIITAAMWHNPDWVEFDTALRVRRRRN